MNNFEYYTPTKVVFGRDTERQTGALIREQGAKKVLIHYGGGSVVRSGLLDLVKTSLDTESIPYVELGGVVPNPRLSLVNEGIELSRREGVDFILAVGGGSVIDSAKAISYGTLYSGDVWDFYDRKLSVTAALPVGVVLTLSATGSEMSDSSVITNENGLIKRGYSSNLGRPKFAVMDPALTISLPDYQTACGCTDIMMHTMERYFTSKGNMEITDSIAEGLIRTVMKNALILRDDPKNYDARAEIMWEGSLSHNGLTGCGNGGNDFVTHALEHELSGIYDVAHGAGLSALWGSWARFVCKDCLARFKRFAVNVMGIADTGDDEKTALSGIAATEDFFRSINMPTSLRELGITASDEDVVIMSHKCAIATGNSRGAAKVITEPDMLEIYKMAM